MESEPTSASVAGRALNAWPCRPVAGETLDVVFEPGLLAALQTSLAKAQRHIEGSGR